MFVSYFRQTGYRCSPQAHYYRMFIFENGKKASLFGNEKEWNVS